MKRLFTILLAITLCISLTGCMTKYVDDVSAPSLSDALERGVKADGGYRESDDDFMTISIGVPDYYIKDYRIVLARDDMNANEIGVFRANSKSDAQEIAKYCRRYVDIKASGWNYDYNPDENVKIENAKVHVFGVYVIYTVLTPEDTDYALIVIDNLIAEGN